MVLIYAFGEISGAHFNPAVSTACFISRRLSAVDYVVYVLVQTLGAVVGAVMYAVLFWQSFNISPKPGFHWFQAGLCEVIYTGMLCFVVLNCAVAGRKGGGQFAGLAIGFVIIAAGPSAGPVSGAVLNPAIAFAIDISSAGIGFGWSVAYIGWELMGVALACVFFRLCRPIEFGTTDKLIFSETKYGQETRLSMLVSEFLGTFILTLTVGLNVMGLSPEGAWSIGASLMCMIYSLGDVSGAQFNPAVTLAVVATGRYDTGVTSPLKGVTFMGVQFIAGICGAWMFSTIYSLRTWSLGPVDDYTWAARIPVEIFFTFVLCLTVLCLTTARGPKDDIIGFAIGMCVVVGGYVVSTVAGGTMNPAVTVGVASTSFVCTHCLSLWWSILYVLLEFGGAGLAAAIFVLTRPGEFSMGMKGASLLPDMGARAFRQQVETPQQSGGPGPFNTIGTPSSSPQVARPPQTGASMTMATHPANSGPYSLSGPTGQRRLSTSPGLAAPAATAPFGAATGSMGGQMPGFGMDQGVPSADIRPPPVYSVIQADDYVNLSGQSVPVFKEYQLTAMHATQLREYAELLSQLIGPGHSPIPESDAALMSWTKAMQRGHLFPLLEQPRS